jgi:hypothetical protein
MPTFFTVDGAEPLSGPCCADGQRFDCLAVPWDALHNLSWLVRAVPHAR